MVTNETSLVNLHESPLFKQIAALDVQHRMAVINDQALMGFFPNFERQKRIQRLANFHKLEVAQKLSLELNEKKISHAFIKGVTFLDTLYQDFGTRFMSDIDLFIDADINYEDILLSQDFVKREDKKWRGNEHKEEWVHCSTQIILEVHKKIFWHCDNPKDLSIMASNGLMIFEPEFHFVYLCGHYAFQHTCQKLYWLIDIELFLNNYDLDWKKVQVYANQLKLKRSVSYVLKVLNFAFNRTTLISMGPSLFPIEDDLFLSDRMSPFYLCLKTYLKDSWMDNIRYNSAWLSNLLPIKKLSKRLS